jgi:hypothetical protein
MPFDFTDIELETTARACRASAFHEEQAAKKMENPLHQSWFLRSARGRFSWNRRSSLLTPRRSGIV